MKNCPSCNSNYIVMDGKIRRIKIFIQRYKCNSCGKRFIERAIGSKHYHPNVILDSFTYYNKGNTLEDTCKIVNKKFHVKIYPQLINSWLKQYEKLCGYRKIRGHGKQKDPIFRHGMEHRQIYEFAYHKIKVEKFINDYFRNLKDFLIRVPEECPHWLFRGDNARGSQIKLEISPDVKKFENSAVLLSKMILEGNRDNRKRHEEIQNFLLTNDTSTLAIEVPVWLSPKEVQWFKMFKEIDKPITGHIDILQQRYGMIHILDYKPNAEKENPVSQLFFYALALSKRTNIWLRNFKCAWFNDWAYYEFNPSDIVLKNEDISRAEIHKYILDRDKQLFHEKRMINEDGLKTKKEIMSLKKYII